MEPENKYLPELMAEKDSLDPSFTHAMQLLSAGTARGSAGRGGPAPLRGAEGWGGCLSNGGLVFDVRHGAGEARS